MENRIIALERQMNALITQFLPPVLKRLEALEAAQAQAQAETKKAALSGRTKRKARTYEDYCAVMDLTKDGVSDQDIAIQLDIPYTTVRSYKTLAQDAIDKLRDKWREQGGKGRPDRVIPAPEPAARPEPAPQASGEVVGTVVARTAQEQAYMAAQQRRTDDLAVSEVQASDGVPTVVQCPAAPEPYGSQGWLFWPEDCQDEAAKRYDENRYPLIRPCQPEELVDVVYMNGMQDIGIAAGSIAWDYGCGIVRWRPHTSS